MHDDTRAPDEDRHESTLERQSDPDDATRVGDTLTPRGAGRVTPAIGATQGGTPSHQRAAFDDPVVPVSDVGGAVDGRVAGAMPRDRAPATDRADEVMMDQGGGGARRTGRARDGLDVAEADAGAPVRRVGLPDDRPPAG